LFSSIHPALLRCQYKVGNNGTLILLLPFEIDFRSSLENFSNHLCPALLFFEGRQESRKLIGRDLAVPRSNIHHRESKSESVPRSHRHTFRARFAILHCGQLSIQVGGYGLQVLRCFPVSGPSLDESHETQEQHQQDGGEDLKFSKSHTFSFWKAKTRPA